MAINENGVQVERQYIGARYVPKFFKGVNGSPEWVAGLAYEALTIVTYLGNSFTSKVPVPAGVGNPADNPGYWVNTGNYNAQVDAYREEVEKIKNSVSNLDNGLTNEISTREQQYNSLNAKIEKINSIQITSNSNVIFISDSYGEWPTTSNNWISQTVQKLGLTNYHIVQEGGTGFTTTPNWLTLLQNTDIPNKDTITHIIIGGGANDSGKSTYSKILADGKTFIGYAKNQFPNALIIIAPFGYGWGSGNSIICHGNTRANMVRAYTELSQRNVVVIPNICYVLQNTDYLISPGVHPNEAGTEAMVNKLCEFLLTGQCNVIYSRHLESWTLEGQSKPVIIDEALTNDTLSISVTHIDWTNLTLSSGSTNTYVADVAPFKHCLGNDMLIATLTGSARWSAISSHDIHITMFVNVNGKLGINLATIADQNSSIANTSLKTSLLTGTMNALFC